MINHNVAPVHNLLTAREQSDVIFKLYYYRATGSSLLYRAEDTVPTWFFYVVENLRKLYEDLQWTNRYSDYLEKLSKDPTRVFRS